MATSRSGVLFVNAADTTNDDSLYLYKADPTAAGIVNEYTGKGGAGDFFASTKPRVVEFYNPYCGHCRRYAPTYISNAKYNRETYPDLEFYAVSCAAHNKICENFSVGGVPSIMTLPAGQETYKMIDYDSPPTKEIKLLTSYQFRFDSLPTVLSLSTAKQEKRALASSSSSSKASESKSSTESKTETATEKPENPDLDKYKVLLKEKLEQQRKRRFQLQRDKAKDIKYLGKNREQVTKGATHTMKANTPGTIEFADKKKELLKKLEKIQNKRKPVKELSAKVKEEPDKLGKLPFKKVVPKPVVAEKVPIVKQWVHMTEEEELMLDVSLSFMKSLEFGLFKQPGALLGQRKQAFKDWLDLLSIALPPEWGLLELIVELNERFEYVSAKSENLHLVLASYPLPRNVWSKSCGYDKVGIGLGCGFWKLLHMITVGVAETRGGLNLVHSEIVASETKTFAPLEVTDTIRNYIEHFFHCTECAKHFLEQYDDCDRNRRCDRLVPTVDDTTDHEWKQPALWMWEFHNEVSVRLLNDRAQHRREQQKRVSRHMQNAGEDEALSMFEEIQALWPTLHDCVTCFNADGTWNEDAVFLYLERTYWPSDLDSLKRNSRSLVWLYSDEDGPGSHHLTIVLILVGVILAYCMRNSLTEQNLHRTVLLARSTIAKGKTTMTNGSKFGGAKRAV